MLDAGRRPMGRLCCLAVIGMVAWGLGLPASGAAPGPQSGPATTTVADTVYLADGTAAQGALIITWPAFLTASGAQVAAGTTNAAVTNGAFSVALVPNVGATPAGVYYTVVYQLGPGQVKVEYWAVPTTSPANLAAVRITPGSGVAGQPVSLQYVNSALATKADDSAVVHLGGTETISGTKTFSAAPSVPSPTSSGQVANKAYVDQSVSNVGGGNFLPTAGGTMTGPITLPANPAAPMQAATKQYVDTGLASKSDLISGLVPVAELGTGQTIASNCLLGNGTWGACAAGGTGNLSTTPTASQTIAQPVGTQFSTNNLANIRYVTASWNWAQTPADNLATPGSLTIHLSPCPLGIDTTSSTNFYKYKVYISGTGTAEAVPVTGGSCTPGASSGTITVTTANAHAAGYTVGSASSGIQEAWNDAWTNDTPVSANSSTAPYVKLTSDTQYNVYAAVYLRGKGGILDGAGALIACSTRDRCIYIGTTQGFPAQHHHKLYNLTGTSTVNVDGVTVASVSATSGTYTVTTGSAHPFLVGDMVDCEYYSQTAAQHWASPVLSVPGGNSFTVALGSSTFSAGANTFGFCNILNTFIEDNSDHAVVQDLNLFQLFPSIGTGYFTYGIVNDNDQQFIIERVSNRSSGVLKNSANWPTGAFVYERNDQGNAGITYMHASEISNVNCVTGGGNGFVLTDTVCQGFPFYGVRYFGGLQPATFQNVYEESTGGSTNPLYGLAAQMGYVVQGGVGTKFLGTFPISGFSPVFAAGGGAGAERTYFVVPHSSTQGYGPMLLAGWAQPATGSTNVTLQWPSIELQSSIIQSVGTLTWDVLVTTGQSAVTPYGTGAYAIATNISGSCGTNGMCSFIDTQAAPATYTVQTQTFNPVFWFWPVNLAINNTTVYADEIGFDPQAVASQGATGIAIVADQCQPGGVYRRRSPIWVSCIASSISSGTAFLSTLLQQQYGNGGPPANSKGRINLGTPLTNPPNDLITLGDSNLAKTLSTAGERPLNDAGDMAIGIDQTGGLSQRATTSITSYINVVPSGTNYLERLTAAGKTLNVPLTVNGGLAVSGGSVTLPVTGTSSQCLHVSATGVLTGTGADCGSGGGGSGTVNSGTTSQVAVYSGTGTAVSGDSALTDSGTTLNYSGSGGIAAASGTFSGNLTVNGQLMVAGPWTVSSPIPGAAMGAAGAGTSTLGISNDGNFYISPNGGTPQKVATTATSSFFSNLTQEDANTLGEFNSTTAQALHVYGTYTNSSNYERTGLGWDGTNNYFVVKNENAGTGQQRGLGFAVGGSIRWGINTASELKPFSNNSFNIGDASFAPQTIFAGTSFDTLTQGRLNFEMCNDGATGTSLNFLAVYNGASPECAVKAGASNTDGVIGVVSNGSGTSGNAVITYRGYVPCSFDGTPALGDYVVASTTNPGDCHDSGASRPGGVQVLGRVESLSPGGGTYGVRLSLEGPAAAAVNVLPGAPLVSTGGGTAGGVWSAASLDVSAFPGATLDVAWNTCNTIMLIQGGGTCNAMGMGTGIYPNGSTANTGTIAAEMYAGGLPKPGLSQASGGSLTAAATYRAMTTYINATSGNHTVVSKEASITLTGSNQTVTVTSPTTYSGQVPASLATQYGVWLTPANGASGSEVYCGAFNLGFNAAITANCAGAAKAGQGENVAFLLPPSGQWNVTITDGVSCGIEAFDGAILTSESTGITNGQFVVHSNSSAANVNALVCTDTDSSRGMGRVIKMRGVRARNDNGATMTNAEQAAFVIGGNGGNLVDGSVFQSIGAAANAGTGLWVANVCCNDLFENVQTNGLSSPAGGQPLHVGDGASQTRGVTFLSTTAVNTGNGVNNIFVGQNVQGVSFTGATYLEGSKGNGCDTTNHFIEVNGTNDSVTFDSSYVGGGCAGTTAATASESGTTATLTSTAGNWGPGFASGVSITVSGCSVGGYNGTFNVSGGGSGGTTLTYAASSGLGSATGCTANLTNGNTQYMFDVTNAGAFAERITGGGGATVNFINDHVNSKQKVGTALNTEFGSYSFSNGGPAVFGGGLEVVGTFAADSTATAPTPTSSDNSTNVATTAFVKAQGYAPLASAALTGTPTAPTAAANTNTTQVATTAYVVGQMLPNNTSNPWLTVQHAGSTAGNPFSSTSGKASVYGILLQFPKTTSQVSYFVNAADNTSNTYDIGIYSGTSGGTCTLVAHTGSTAGTSFAPTATTWMTKSWTGGSVTLAPGRYYLAITSSATTGTLTTAVDNAALTFAGSAGNVSVSTGGTLDSTRTCPTDAYTTSTTFPAWAVN